MIWVVGVVFVQIEPLMNHILCNQPLIYSRSKHASVYSQRAQSLAALAEIFCNALAYSFWYVRYLTGTTFLVTCVVEALVTAVMTIVIIELVLRWTYSQLNLRTYVAIFVILISAPIASHLFDLPSAEGEVNSWTSRAQGQPPLLSVFDSHDLWHIFSGIALAALQLMIQFFGEPVRPSETCDLHRIRKWFAGLRARNLRLIHRSASGPWSWVCCLQACKQYGRSQ